MGKMRISSIIPLIFVVLLCFPDCSLFGQGDVLKPNPCPPLGADSLKPVPYTSLREADVMWSKRVWRTIDLREKINHPLYYPTEPDQQCRISLFDLIKRAIIAEEITAYGSPLTDDEFKYPMSKEEIEKMFSRIDTNYVPDLETGEMVPVAVKINIGSQDIKQFWIKEDWFFDKQRSVLDVRIIGLCPLRENKGDNGEVRGYSPMFWVYFPECRPIFARITTFNRNNDSQKLTYDQLFWKRQFGSYINKESNVYDRSIAEYKMGLEALLEAERIKEEIFLLEHDLWHY